ncbi:MAG: hypothetical protein E7631_02715 [Ruminococcaceae bacterium]|nr:hypothetical protein [Oscillospiraceae bacterium]
MKSIRYILSGAALTGLLPLSVSAAGTEAETMAILSQEGAGSDGILIIGFLCVVSGIWVYQYFRKKRKHNRHHHKHHS